MKEDFLKNLKKSKKIKLDLKDGIILDLTYDDKIKAYRGYSPDINAKVGIFTVKTLFEMKTDPKWNCELIMED